VKKPTVKIFKGKEAYLDITALAAYCREQGYRVIEETVTIELPTGKEYLRFRKDVETGKIIAEVGRKP